MTDDAVEETNRRLERIERVLEAQRAYIRRVPDPDNRYRAETNLLTLLEMRDALRKLQEEQTARPTHPSS